MYPEGRASRGAGIARDVRSFHPGQVGDQVQLNVNVFLRSVIQVLTLTPTLTLTLTLTSHHAARVVARQLLGRGVGR